MDQGQRWTGRCIRSRCRESRDAVPRWRHAEGDARGARAAQGVRRAAIRTAGRSSRATVARPPHSRALRASRWPLAAESVCERRRPAVARSTRARPPSAHGTARGPARRSTERISAVRGASPTEWPVMTISSPARGGFPCTVFDMTELLSGSTWLVVARRIPYASKIDAHGSMPVTRTCGRSRPLRSVRERPNGRRSGGGRLRRGRSRRLRRHERRASRASGGTSAGATCPPRLTFVRHSPGAARRSAAATTPPATARTGRSVAPAWRRSARLTPWQPASSTALEHTERRDELLRRPAHEDVLTPASEPGLGGRRNGQLVHGAPRLRRRVHGCGTPAAPGARP